MFPVSKETDTFNGTCFDREKRCDGFIRHAVLMHAPNTLHLRWKQLCMGVSPCHHRICPIQRVGPRRQVGRIDARWCMAQMPDNRPVIVWNARRRIMQCPAKTVDKHAVAIHADFPVPHLIAIPCPQPVAEKAIGGMGAYSHSRPEPRNNLVQGAGFYARRIARMRTVFDCRKHASTDRGRDRKGLVTLLADTKDRHSNLPTGCEAMGPAVVGDNVRERPATPSQQQVYHMGKYTKKEQGCLCQ